MGVTTQESGGRAPTAGGQRGLGRSPNAAAIFPVFLKNKNFYADFGLNFCLKTYR